jgi:hypothetical protein
VGLRSIPVINTIGWTEDEKRAYHPFRSRRLGQS